MTEMSGNPQLAATLDPLLHRGVSDPSRVFARAFSQAGVAFHMERGRVVLDPQAPMLYAARR